MNDNSLCKLSDILSNTQWNDLTDTHNANTAYDTFHDKFSQIYNNCIPLITKTICLDRPYRPWITKGIFKSIHKTSRLHKEGIKKNTDNSISKYTIYKNKLIKLLEMRIKDLLCRSFQ